MRAFMQLLSMCCCCVPRCALPGTWHYLHTVLGLPVRLTGIDTNQGACQCRGPELWRASCQLRCLDSLGVKERVCGAVAHCAAPLHPLLPSHPNAALMERSNRACADLGIADCAHFHTAGGSGCFWCAAELVAAGGLARASASQACAVCAVSPRVARCSHQGPACAGPAQPRHHPRAARVRHSHRRGPRRCVVAQGAGRSGRKRVCCWACCLQLQRHAHCVAPTTTTTTTPHTPLLAANRNSTQWVSLAAQAS
jgi:hypothetical protein